MDETTFGFLGPETLGLFTDLYEVRMQEGYLATGHDPPATFSLFVRDLPADRGYLVAAGLEQVVHYVETLAFDDAALASLESIGVPESQRAFLAEFSFTGELRAVPEGTVVFPDEPIIEVTAPIAEAQLFETLLVNQVAVQTLLATKAARMRDVVDRRGDGQTLVDFGSRRAHGTDAGMKAARAAYVGGFDGTSNVAAGEAFALPVYGTMAHSWVQSFRTEREAFEAFVDVFGEASVLLVDTYDTVGGTETAMAVAADRGIDLAGIRLDSGDLPALSQAVAPLVGDADVFVSSGMDEDAIADFFAAGGVADGFGPGTALVTSADAPALEAVYKLVAVDGDPTMKLSAGKRTYPGQKSLYRRVEAGAFVGDVLDERGAVDPADDLLETVIEDGERVGPLPSLDEIRERRAEQVAALPADVRAIRDPGSYPVEVGDALAATTASLAADLERRYG